MFPLISLLLTFLIIHSFSSVPKIRKSLIDFFGERNYLKIYSLISFIILIKLFDIAIKAPYIEVWKKNYFLCLIPHLLMPISFILLAFGITTPNPLSILTPTNGFNPNHPGFIIRITRHPILLSIIVWSGCHLFPNGSLPLILLFGSFFIFSIIGIFIVDNKIKRSVGKWNWINLSKGTSIISLTPFLYKSNFNKNDLLRIILGFVLYAVFLNYLHEFFFKVNPLLLLIY